MPELVFFECAGAGVKKGKETMDVIGFTFSVTDETVPQK